MTILCQRVLLNQKKCHVSQTRCWKVTSSVMVSLSLVLMSSGCFWKIFFSGVGLLAADIPKCQHVFAASSKVKEGLFSTVVEADARLVFSLVLLSLFFRHVPISLVRGFWELLPFWISFFFLYLYSSNC